MHFGQFLVGEGRSKVGVACLEQFKRVVLGLRIELMMAGTPTFLGEQSWIAKASVGFQQPFDLANADVELLGRMALFDAPFVELAHHLSAAQFFLAHV